MDIGLVEMLASIVVKQQLNVLEVSEGETRIRIEKRDSDVVNIDHEKQNVPSSNPGQDMKETVDFNKLEYITSPLVGVYYDASAPGAEPFVQIGSKVSKGDILCIIEAMKLMNEIKAESDGEIVDICAQNGEIVEYGQTLFKLY